VRFKGAGGDEFFDGVIDSVEQAAFSVRFAKTSSGGAAVPNPDDAAPSLRIKRQASLKRLLTSALGELTNPNTFLERPTLQNLVERLARITGLTQPHRHLLHGPGK
jgi:hypothetical protein